MRVSDLMTTPVVTVTPETSLKAVAATLAARRIAGVIVMRDGLPVGVVSESDLVQFEEEAEDESVRGRRFWHGRRRRRSPSRTVADLLHAPLLAIEPQSSAVAAAWAMGRNDVGRLAVIDHGALVGIVTRADLIRALARGDAVRSVLGVVDVVSDVSSRHEHRRFDTASAAL